MSTATIRRPSDRAEDTFLQLRLSRPNWFVEQWRDRPERVWLFLILSVALALRIVRLGTWPYWHDEAYSLILTEDLPRTLSGDLVSNHPPLFTILLYFWRNLGLAQNEWGARFLVVLLGLCSVCAVYTVTRRLIDTRTALVAAFLVAISPLHVVHSQDLKEYMVLPVSGPITVYFLYRATEEKRTRLWFLYGLWAGIACYSDLFAGPLLVSVNLWYVIRTRLRGGTSVRWLLANLFGAALFLPQLGIMLHKAEDILIGTQDWWLPRPTVVTAAFYMKALAFGYSDLDPHFKIALVVYVVFAAIGALVALRKNRWAAVLVMFWFVVPVGIVYTFSQFTQSAFLIRAMLPYGLAFYILAAAGVAWLRPVPPRTLALLGLAVLAAFPLSQRYRDEYTLHEFPHRPGVHPPLDYRALTRFIVDRWEEGDIVTHGSGSSWISTFYYGLRGRPTFQISPSAAYTDFVNRSHPDVTQDETFLAYLPHNPQTLLQGYKRVWYVFADWEREYLSGNAMDAWRWLDSHYTELLHQRFNGIEVFLYGRELEGNPVRTIARLLDDGAAAQLVYRAGDKGFRYLKIQPDSGIVASEPEARRGALQLQLQAAVGGPVFDLAPGRPGRSISFALENQTKDPVSCRVECVASDALLEVASLWETEPGSDVWRIASMYNPKAPPPTFEVSTVVAELKGPTLGGLRGSIALPPGRYEARPYLLGWPGDTTSHRAPMQIRIAGRDILDAPGQSSDEWRWWQGVALDIPDGLGVLPIEITAQSLPALAKSWVNTGYIAFRRTYPEVTLPPAGMPIDPWPGNVLIAPHGRQVWTIRTDTLRLDIWVYSDENKGLAYRVFQELTKL